MKLDTQSRSSSYIKIWPSEAAVHQHSTEQLFWKTLRVIRKWWSSFSILKTLRQWCFPFSVLKTLRCREKVMEFFFSINNFKSCKKVTEFFFSIKNVKSRIAVMEFFLGFRNYKSRKKMTESLFSGHALLSFHMMHKFPGTIFSLSAPTEFLWLYFFDYTF